MESILDGEKGSRKISSFLSFRWAKFPCIEKIG
jgi:hypothetical protein